MPPKKKPAALSAKQEEEELSEMVNQKVELDQTIELSHNAVLSSHKSPSHSQSENCNEISTNKLSALSQVILIHILESKIFQVTKLSSLHSWIKAQTMIRPTKLGKSGFGGEGFDDDMEVCKNEE